MLPTLLSSIRPVVLVRSDPAPREAPWQSTQHLALLYQGGAGAHTVITREGGVGQGPVGQVTGASPTPSLKSSPGGEGMPLKKGREQVTASV